MENKLHKRILSAVLAVLILFGYFPVSGVHAEEVANPYAGNKGGTAQFNPALYDDTFDSYTYAYLTDDPAKGLVMSTEHTLSPEGLFDLQMIILDVYASAEGYWYKVGAAQGHTLPDALVAMPWVYQNELSDNSYYPDTLLVTPPAVEPSEPSEPSDPSEPEVPAISAPITDANGNPTGQTVTVSGEALPEGAQVVASIPSVNGETSLNIFDIKVMVPNAEGQLVEWQPIDEGKTVTLSIPVTGMEDGSYVDVNHFIDYAADINGDEYIFPTNDIDSAWLSALQPMLDAYGDGVHIAVEKVKKLQVSNGHVQVETDSFSIYQLDNDQYIKQDTELDEEGRLKVTFNTKFDWPWNQEPPYTEVTQTIYASPDQLFLLTTSESTTIADPYSIIERPADATNEKTTPVSILNNKDAYLENIKGEKESWGLAQRIAKLNIVNLVPGDVVWIACRSSKTTLGNSYCYMKVVIVDEVEITFDKNLSSATLGKDSYSQVPTDGDEEKKLFTIPTTAEYIPVSTDPHYKFIGWNTSPAGDGTSYRYDSAAGTFSPDAFTPMRDMTLYAMWDADNYVVAFDANGGNEQYESVTANKNSTILLPDEPTRADYIFIGWSASTDGYSTVYPAGAEFTVKQDTTMYALWAVNLTIIVAGGDVTLWLEDEFESKPLDDLYYASSGNKMFEKTVSDDGTVTYRGTPIEGFLRNARFTFTYDYAAKNATVSTSNQPLVTTVLEQGQIFATIASSGMDKSTSISFTAVEKGKVSYVVSYIVNFGTPVESNVFQGYSDAVFKIDQLPETTRKGYRFDGWYKDEALTDGPYTKLENIRSNIILYAKWAPKIYEATFQYDAVRVVTVPYSSAESITLDSPTKENHSFYGWKVSEVRGDENNWTVGTIYREGNTPAGMYGNVTLVPQWAASVSASIDNNGTIDVVWGQYRGSATGNWSMDNVPVNYGAGATITFTPAEHYVITGVTGADKYESAENGAIVYKVGENGIGGPVSIAVTTALKRFTVTYEDETGFAQDKDTAEYGSDLTLPVPSEPGYRFDGWYLNEDFSGTPVTQLTNITDDVTLYAKWTPITYNVTFVDWDAAVLKTQTVIHGSAATAPDNPQREGHTFTGWDKAFSNVTGDLVVTAQYTVNQYTITFDTHGGTEIAPITQDFGTQVTAPANPTRTGYDFAGWSPVIPTTMPAENITVKAIWAVATLTLKGSIAHGTVTGPVTVEYGSAGELEFTADPGYVMTGWEASNGQKGTINSSQQFTWSFSHPNITEDLTVTVFTKPIDYAITYDGMDEATVNPANPVTYHIESGEITLNNPTKPGYIFTGWTGTDLTEATMEVSIPTGSTGNRAYTANWKLAEYTITYDLNGGSGTSTESTYNIHDTDTMLPATAVKKGYLLAGWKAVEVEGSWVQNRVYDAGMKVTDMYGNVTLQAQWKPQEYKITYHLNGGTGPETGTYTIETETFALPTPSRNGYVFQGWYEKADFTGSEVTQIQKGSKDDKTFYAKWEVIHYTIRYSGIDGATVNPANPADYTIASGSITLTKPEKEDYAFQGWTGTGLTGPTMEVTIPTGSTGDRAYTATWSTSIYGAIVCEGDDAVGTIFWNGDSSTAVNSPLELSGANAMVGAYKKETLTFKPNTGYKIKGVTVNGEAVSANDFTEEGYTYAFDEAGLTEPLKIVVTTEVVSVTVSIVITGASGEPETIEVQEGSDILIAFTPDGGQIHSIQLDYAAGPNDQPPAKTVTLTGDLSQGYIFTAHQLKQNVTITIDTTTPKIYHAVGVINAGTVELTYGDETVKSTDSTADKHLPLDTRYTLRVNSDTDQGYLIKTVNDTAVDGNPTFYEDSDEELDAGTFTVVAYAEIAEFTLSFYQDDGNIYHTITQNYGTKVTPPDVPQASADPNKSGYVFDGWVDSQNQDDAKYISVPSTMPNRDMSFYAKWVDPLLEQSQNVYVGINMSFYMTSNDSLYYKLPANEPAQQYNIHAARVYFAATDRSKWILPAGSWNHPLPGKPTDYISEDIIIKGTENGNVFGISAVNPDGTVNNRIREENLLKLDSDYKNIVQAWLDACRNDQAFRNQYSTANIDWDKLPAEPELYDVIPYVIKRHADANVSGAQAWHIDVIIVPKTKYTVTYDLGVLKDHADYQVQCPASEIKKYGEGFKVNVASMQDAVNVQDNRYVAKFDGWTASVDSVVISDGGKGSFTMPGEDVTLTAQWKLPVDFSIEYYKKNPAEDRYEKVEADTVNLIGYVGDTPAVSKTYTGYVQKQIEDGTVQGKNHVIKVYYDPITYTVVFHADNGTDAATFEQTFTYDLEDNLHGNTFTKPGFAFAGWTDGTNEYTDGQLVKNLASTQDAQVHLNAVYTPNTLTITQSGMDGQDAGIYVILKDGQEVARVMIKGNSSVKLEQIPEGNYTVREISQNWTWKYAPSAEIDVTVFAHPTQQQNKVTFTLDHKVPVDWLHGEDTN